MDDQQTLPRAEESKIEKLSAEPTSSASAEKENHCEEESKKLPCTPALAKVRQSRLEFKVHSPSDALMSPCTKTLNEGGQRKPKSAFSHPQHLLRNKQHKEIMRKRPED